jgi:cytochrome c-type biogenesis protein CcmH
MVRISLLIAFFMSFVLTLAYAGEAIPTADDVVLENRVTALTSELRCLVCQNQTIAESHAALAIDLKNEVREMLRQGKTEEEIKNYMVARYGDFVLYRPQLKSSTWVLWTGPFVLLALAFGVLAFKLRQRRKAMQQASNLSLEERSRVASLLSGSNEEGRRE